MMMRKFALTLMGTVCIRIITCVCPNRTNCDKDDDPGFVVARPTRSDPRYLSSETLESIRRKERYEIT